MALKNDEKISKFGQRLLDMMKEKGCDTTPVLAERLLEEGLVKVNSRKGSDPFKKKNNAIGSIERKIRVHIHSDDGNCLQGEFVIAYCKFFDCSADYLFGFTDIKSPSMDVRAICEKTGLAENSVNNLVAANKSSQKEMIIGSWSMILSSRLFESIPSEWLEAANHAINVGRLDAQIKAITWEMDKVSGPDKLDLQLDTQGYVEQARAESAAFSGLLFKISRNLADYIENDINYKLTEVRGAFEKGFLSEVMKKYK